MRLRKNSNGNGNGRKRNGNGGGKLLKMSLLAFAVLLVGLLLYRQAQNLLGPKRQVLVASTNLAAGALLTADDLELDSRRERNLPETALADASDAEGRQLVRPKQQGEPITSEDVRAPATVQARASSLAELLPAGRVLTTLTVEIENVLMSELRFGDRFSVLALGGGNAAAVVASDAYFLAWVDPNMMAGGGGRRDSNDNGNGRRRGGMFSSLFEIPGREGGGGPMITSSTRLLLALYPQDVLPVSEAEGGGATLTIVIHGRKEVEAGQLLALTRKQDLGVEMISGASRRNVEFSN